VSGRELLLESWNPPDFFRGLLFLHFGWSIYWPSFSPRSVWAENSHHWDGWEDHKAADCKFTIFTCNVCETNLCNRTYYLFTMFGYQTTREAWHWKTGLRSTFTIQFPCLRQPIQGLVRTHNDMAVGT
jgi:hypothetical protein